MLYRVWFLTLSMRWRGDHCCNVPPSPLPPSLAPSCALSLYSGKETETKCEEGFLSISWMSHQMEFEVEGHIDQCFPFVCCFHFIVVDVIFTWSIFITCNMQLDNSDIAFSLLKLAHSSVSDRWASFNLIHHYIDSWRKLSFLEILSCIFGNYCVDVALTL